MTMIVYVWPSGCLRVVEGDNHNDNDDDKKYFKKCNSKSQNVTAHAEK